MSLLGFFPGIWMKGLPYRSRGNSKTAASLKVHLGTGLDRQSIEGRLIKMQEVSNSQVLGSPRSSQMHRALSHQGYVRMVKTRLQLAELPARENFNPFVFRAVQLTVTASSSRCG